MRCECPRGSEFCLINDVCKNTTYHNPIQGLRRAVVDIDTADASLRTRVGVEEPEGLVHQLGSDGDRLNGDVAPVPSIAKPRVKPMETRVGEVEESARATEARLCGGMVALCDCRRTS